MADNYLEKSYEDYKAREAHKARERQSLWQKQLKAYRQRLKETDSPTEKP